MPRLTSLPGDTPDDRIVEVLQRDGALILEDLIAPDAVDALVAELRPYV